jgi:hypothetical protein
VVGEYPLEIPQNKIELRVNWQIMEIGIKLSWVVENEK